MFYQLTVNAFFDDHDALDDVLDKLNDAKDHMKVINPGQPNQECSVIDTIDNHHDQDPNGPCTLTSHWDNCPTPP